MEKIIDVIELLTFLIPFIVLLISLFVNKVLIRKPIRKLFVSLILIYLIFVIPMMIVFCFKTFTLFYNLRIETQFFVNLIFDLIFKLTLAYKPILYILYDTEFNHEFKSNFLLWKFKLWTFSLKWLQDKKYYLLNKFANKIDLFFFPEKIDLLIPKLFCVTPDAC